MRGDPLAQVLPQQGEMSVTHVIPSESESPGPADVQVCWAVTSFQGCSLPDGLSAIRMIRFWERGRWTQ